MGSVSAPEADAAAGLDEGVFDPVEDPAVVIRLLRDAGCGMELLVEDLLLFGQRPRDEDVEIHELIPAPARSKARDALALEPHRLSVLRARRDPHLRAVAFDGGDVELVAERGLRRRDAKHVDEIVALAPEARVVLEANQDVEVARRAGTGAGLALAGDAELLAVVDAGGDRQHDVALLALAALTPAPGAQLVDRLPRAAAPRAGGHVDEPAEHRLLDLAHLAPTLALLARGDRRARLGAVAAAALAGLEPRDLDPPLASPHRVDELDLELHAQIRAAHRSALTTTRLATEEGVEQVVDPEPDGPVAGAEHVVALPPLRVGQHLVGLGHLAEPRGRLIGLVDVRVVLARELAVRAADLVLGRLTGDAQDGVVIAAGHA